VHPNPFSSKLKPSPGQDNQGDRWTTSRWRDTTITTVEPPPERQ